MEAGGYPAPYLKGIGRIENRVRMLFGRVQKAYNNRSYTEIKDNFRHKLIKCLRDSLASDVPLMIWTSSEVRVC
jgi:hypothetical protein